MDKKTSASLSLDMFKPIGKLFKRFHLTIFFVFIVACLVGAVLLINNTLQESTADSGYTSSINAGTIDEATLNRLNSLHTSSQGTPAPELPEGRINPFGE